MKNKEKIWNQIVQYAAAFCIPVIGLLIAYTICDVMPFGAKSILTGDCEIQYAPFLNYMREILQGNASPFYTFSKTLGGDLSSFLSYYCLSPFNVLLLLFDVLHIQEAVLLLILVKTGCAGAAMYALLSKKQKTSWQTLLFSTAYALMGYNTAYQHNLMWLDGLVFLPFIVIGLEQLLRPGKERKQNKLYLFSLALLLLTNYYIGYMLCIFSVLYMVYYLFFDDEAVGENWKSKRKSLAEFIKASLLAGGLAAITLLPTALSLRGGKAEFDLRELVDFKVLYSPVQIIKELFIGNYAVKGDVHSLPNIYCGMFILILLMVYFAGKRYSRREKIGYAGLLAVLMFSFMLSGIDRIWHGTTVPAGSPHRYSFLLSFCLILAAYKGYTAMRVTKLSLKQTAMGAAGYLVLLAVYFIARKTVDFWLFMNLGAGVALLSGLYWVNNQKEWKKQKIVWIVLAGWIGTELIWSACVTFRAYERKDRAVFAADLQSSERYVRTVQEQDHGWYRMEQYGTNVTMNDAMLYQYDGLWSYSSCEKEVTKRLAGKMGLNDRTWWITYHNEMPLAAESLLGLKYVISTKEGYQQQYQTVWEDSEEGVGIYRNPYALPLGVLVKTELTDTNMATWDVLALQNDIWKRMTGEKEEIYRPLWEEETAGEEHYLEYTLHIEEELPVYTAFRNYGTIDEMILYVNGTENGRIQPEMQTYRLGPFQTGDTVTVALTGKSDISWYDLYFYYEDVRLLEKYSGMLQEKGLELTEFSQDRISGTVYNSDTEQKLLLLTVPDDRGWVILKDGVLQEPVEVLDHFMGIMIEEGSHRIQLRYIPPGLWQGAGITMAAACIILLRDILVKRRKKFVI